MGVDDLAESEVGIAVAATAALMSPRVRRVARRGAVYGLAGALFAGDAVASAARGVAKGVRGAAPEEKPQAPEPPARPRRTPPTRVPRPAVTPSPATEESP